MTHDYPAREDAPGFPWGLTALVGVALAILLSLGTWQVQRLAWKNALIVTIEDRLADAPDPLASVVADAAAGQDIEYRPVAATGVYLHDREQFFFATHDGQSGWFVYTPLRLDDDRSVFVNRGFVPYDRKAPASRLAGQVEGEVAVSGLARSAPPAKPSALVPDNQPAKNVFYWKDLSAMSANADLDPTTVVPLFIDAAKAETPGGYPVGGVTIIDLPNNHLQYAVTWYGLAAALAGVYVALLARRRQGERTARP